MRSREGQSLRVAVLARSVYPLHRFGGLERHVYDLVRCLLARDVKIALLTPPKSENRPADAAADAVFRHPNFTMRPVPYVTFPFANRRGTTILDRSTAYPMFGHRAGRLAARMASAGEIDIVHGFGASVLGYATAPLDADARVPLVLNPQGLEEFGATDPSRAPLKRLGYWPLRVAVRRAAPFRGPRDCYRSFPRRARHLAPGDQQRGRSRHSQRHRARGVRSARFAVTRTERCAQSWGCSPRMCC